MANRHRPRTRTAALLAAVVAAVLAPACVAVPPESDPVLAAHPDPSPSDVVEDAGRAGTVRVRNLSCEGLGTGSGAVVNGVLVTNRHVVQGADRLEVSTADGRRVEVDVAAVARDTDLAVIEVDGPLPGGLTLAPGDPVPGDAVTAVGFPGGERLTFSDGEVVGETEDPTTGQDPVLLVSARVRPGSSGGPLLDADGRLAGVIFAMRTADGFGLAIPVSRLQDALDTDEMAVPVAPCTRPSLVEQADELGIGTAVAPAPPQTTVPVPCPSGQVELVDAAAGIDELAPELDGRRRWSIEVSGQVRNAATAAVTAITVEVEVEVEVEGQATPLSVEVPGELAPGASQPWSASTVVNADSEPEVRVTALRWRWAEAALAARC